MPWSLIIYGVLALGLIAAFAGVVHTHDNKVKEQALAPWQPLIAQCQAGDSLLSHRSAGECVSQWTGAVAANVGLQQDVARNAQETAACNNKVADLQRQSAMMDKVGAQAKRDNANKLTRAEARAATLQLALTDLQSKKPEATCAQALAKRSGVLLDSADERLRDSATATGNRDGGKAAPAPADPGQGAVRKGGATPGAPGK